jgi:hypothetical protein
VKMHRLFFLFLLLGSGCLFAQDTALVRPALRAHPYFNLAAPATPIRAEPQHLAEGKELLFYGLLGLVFLIAIVRLSFPKYFNDLFRLFFRTTIKQRHLSEQMSQTPLASFLLNLFFFIVSGLYLSLWVNHIQQNPFSDFSKLFLYISLTVAVAYLLKYITLQIAGWLFQAREAAASYVFTVFTINKMMGLFLLPLLIVMAFANEVIFEIVLTISWVILAGLLLYRIILTYRVAQKETQLNRFHFLLYVAGLEFAPLLVFYKFLLLNFK